MAEKNNKKAMKKQPDEPYQDILAFPRTGKVLHLRNKNYTVSV